MENWRQGTQIQRILLRICGVSLFQSLWFQARVLTPISRNYTVSVYNLKFLVQFWKITLLFITGMKWYNNCSIDDLKKFFILLFQCLGTVEVMKIQVFSPYSGSSLKNTTEKPKSWSNSMIAWTTNGCLIRVDIWPSPNFRCNSNCSTMYTW